MVNLFDYTGLSFFNAIYHPTFNKHDAARKMWLNKLKSSDINVVRIWAQWDNARGFTGTCPTCTLYEKDGVPIAVRKEIEDHFMIRTKLRIRNPRRRNRLCPINAVDEADR